MWCGDPPANELREAAAASTGSINTLVEAAVPLGTPSSTSTRALEPKYAEAPWHSPPLQSEKVDVKAKVPSYEEAPWPGPARPAASASLPTAEGSPYEEAAWPAMPPGATAPAPPTSVANSRPPQPASASVSQQPHARRILDDGGGEAAVTCDAISVTATTTTAGAADCPGGDASTSPMCQFACEAGYSVDTSGGGSDTIACGTDGVWPAHPTCVQDSTEGTGAEGTGVQGTEAEGTSTGTTHSVAWHATTAADSAGLTVAVGDSIEFVFASDAHDVSLVPAQADFDACDKGTMTPAGADNAQSPFTYQVTDADTELYFVCSVGGHCGAGQKLHLTVASSAVSPTMCAAISVTASTTAAGAECAEADAATGPTCQFACEAGYSVDTSGGGSDTIACSGDGVWPAHPTCVEVAPTATMCAAISITAATNTAGAECPEAAAATSPACQFVCEAGYSVDTSGGGSDTIACGTDGVWPAHPTCVQDSAEPVICPAIAATSSTTTAGADCAGGDASTGPTCTFTCEAGYSTTEATITCGVDGAWPSHPVCTQDVSEATPAPTAKPTFVPTLQPTPKPSSQPSPLPTLPAGDCPFTELKCGTVLTGSAQTYPAGELYYVNASQVTLHNTTITCE